MQAEDVAPENPDSNSSNDDTVENGLGAELPPHAPPANEVKAVESVSQGDSN